MCNRFYFLIQTTLTQKKNLILQVSSTLHQCSNIKWTLNLYMFNFIFPKKISNFMFFIHRKICRLFMIAPYFLTSLRQSKAIFDLVANRAELGCPTSLHARSSIYSLYTQNNYTKLIPNTLNKNYFQL